MGGEGYSPRHFLNQELRGDSLAGVADIQKYSRSAVNEDRGEDSKVL